MTRYYTLLIEVNILSIGVFFPAAAAAAARDE